MKKRIGVYNKKVVVSGDENLVGPNEIHISDATTVNQLMKRIPTKLSLLENDLLIIAPFEYVDLALPSGLKWATCNVGASSPEEPGLYFAFGETEGYYQITEKKLYSWNDYKWYSNDVLTKYNSSEDYGEVDNLTTLELADDAVYQIDNSARIPTIDDLNELITNTTTSTEILNETRVIKFTSKINNNFIYIPLAGRADSGYIIENKLYGYIASSCVDTEIPYNASCLQILRIGSKASLTYRSRSNGLSIRPVQYTEGLYKLDMKKYYTKSEVSNLLDLRLIDYAKNNEMNLQINEVKEIITNNEMTLMKAIMDLNNRISNLENQN